MNVFTTALDKLGRWYVALPPFFIMLFLAALLLIMGAGQLRLRDAAERLGNSTERQLRIDELERALIQSVNSQRSFLLTGDKSYLARYERDRAEIEPRLERLRLANAELADASADIRNLQILVGKRLADLAIVLDIQQTQGTAAAVSLIETSVGSNASLAISDILEKMRIREVAERARAEFRWYGGLALSRRVTAACTLVYLLLIVTATRRNYADTQRRDLLSAEVSRQNSQINELAELSTHLQRLAEREKAMLARELHDELGGLLVGARMDLSWAEQHLAKDNPDLKLRLNRVQQNLAAGIDLKRRIIEDLRPTLLDNVGLFAALRWQLEQTCGNAGLTCSDAYPAEEPRFTAEAGIALFRIAQEACTNVLKHASARSVSLTLDINDRVLRMQIVDDGIGISNAGVSATGAYGVSSMRHRVRTLGGEVDFAGGADGGTTVTVLVPVANAVAQTIDQAIP